MKSLLILVSVTLLLSGIIGCKKEKQATPVVPPTPCTATIYGYYGAINDNLYGPVAPYLFGTFNSSSATSSGIATINTHIRIGDATYNTTDNCYYTLIAGLANPTLCKVSSTGSVTYYTLPAGTTTYLGCITYNAYSNKLLVIQSDSGANIVSEIIVGAGSNYTLAPVAPISIGAYTPVWLNCNPTNGDIYVTGYTTTNYLVSKITPTSSIPIDSGSGVVTNLRYNTSDNMMYGLHYSSVLPYALIRIDPSGGHIAIADLPVHFNSDFYSTCLDDCNGRYIVSTLKYDTATLSWNDSIGMIYQLDLSGTLMQQNSTSGLFQGLVVKH